MAHFFCVWTRAGGVAAAAAAGAWKSSSCKQKTTKANNTHTETHIYTYTGTHTVVLRDTTTDKESNREIDSERANEEWVKKRYHTENTKKEKQRSKKDSVANARRQCIFAGTKDTREIAKDANGCSFFVGIFLCAAVARVHKQKGPPVLTICARLVAVYVERVERFVCAATYNRVLESSQAPQHNWVWRRWSSARSGQSKSVSELSKHPDPLWSGGMCLCTNDILMSVVPSFNWNSSATHLQHATGQNTVWWKRKSSSRLRCGNKN